jgi:2,3-bisphosphoglycerate-dependent phosphoglycerate mutase
MTITRFCLVRHGETDWNAARRLQGHTDIDLNARGLAQAKQMAQALKKINLQFDVLYTSDLLRAAKTAQAIEALFNTSANSNVALRERHLGALQGLTTNEASTREPELWKSHLSRNIEENLRDGESIQQFSDRIKTALEKIRADHLGKTILLVSHGGALDMMYRIASNQALDAKKTVAVPNASLNWISHNGLTWKVDSWADTSHLDSLALDNLDL